MKTYQEQHANTIISLKAIYGVMDVDAPNVGDGNDTVEVHLEGSFNRHELQWIAAHLRRIEHLHNRGGKP